MNDKERLVPSRCPVCQGSFSITKVTCNTCGSELSGSFKQNKLASLSPKNMEFAEIFVRNRGSIKDIEKELGLSYPTVRTMLDNLIDQMEVSSSQKNKKTESVDLQKEKSKGDILDLLENGSITSAEAIQMLSGL